MAKVRIFRGDTKDWTLGVPLEDWSAGGAFFFGAKAKSRLSPSDASDSNAVVKKKFTDSDISETTSTEVKYNLVLTPADTSPIAPGKYIAEFQWVSSDQSVVRTYKQFTLEVKADVNQRIS